MLAGRKRHAMLLLLLLLLDFAAVVGLWKRCCVNGDGARSTEYMLVSRLLSLLRRRHASAARSFA
jgi:hypothetical protein